MKPKRLPKDVPWKQITSSNIHRVAYFKRRQLLAVEFHSGSIYLYHPVSWSLYMSFRRAFSHGSFFAHEIAQNPSIQCQFVE